jgi:hypothetical protein
MRPMGARSYRRISTTDAGNARRSVGRWASTLRRSVALDPAPVGGTLAEHHPGPDARCAPPALGRDPSRQAPPAIHRPEQIADVHEQGLELDDEHRARRRVPSEDVDHASLAADRERHLGRSLPARCTVKPASEVIVHRGVARIDQPVELAASPAEAHVHLQLEGARDRGEPPDRHGEPAPLDPTHQRSRDGRPCREVLLAQPTPHPGGPDGTRQSDNVHP